MRSRASSSADMANAGRLSHDGFESALSRFRPRNVRRECRLELSDAREATGRLGRFAGHERNMSDVRVTHMGIGVAARPCDVHRVSLACRPRCQADDSTAWAASTSATHAVSFFA